ncbi:MAG: membrane protein [Pseudohongiella sp.]|nr:MAG: membrane protein [Pseudohongiella sp.]
MDTAFFIASKIIWALISPDSLIVILGLSAWIAAILKWQRASRSLLSLCALLLALIGFFPVGEWLISPLENRFTTNAALPSEVDGIVVLGGAILPVQSNIWQQPEVSGGADRLTNFLYLARLFPDAQLVFTGGSGSVSDQEFKEAEMARILFDQLGLAQRAIIYESESRNTAENAMNSKELVTPESDENWVLITSAFHMPRSIGVFCKQQWPVQPYPVDHYSQRGDLLRLNFAFSQNLTVLRTAIREWVGLLAYRISGRTDRLLPGAANYCAAADTE